jgi:hypothetical protein
MLDSKMIGRQAGPRGPGVRKAGSNEPRCRRGQQMKREIKNE